MARGMANNEPIVSQANTEAAREGYDRTFGPDRKPQRGRWVMDPVTKQLVSADSYVPEARAVDAPIMAGRFYEGCQVHDGERMRDLGSRAKHAAYLKEKDLVMMSDYREHYAKAQAKRDAVREKNTMGPDPERRKVLERAFHDISEGKKR